jgi:hypothetical protein
MQKHTPDQIIPKLRAAEIDLASGMTIGQVCEKLAISENTFVGVGLYPRPDDGWQGVEVADAGGRVHAGMPGLGSGTEPDGAESGGGAGRGSWSQ